MSIHFLFFKTVLQWPPRCGGTVHTGNLMRTLVAQGSQVTFVTPKPIERDAANWLAGVRLIALSEFNSPQHQQSLSRFSLKQRLAKYWGVSIEQSQSLRHAATTVRADVVVAVGIETLPYLEGIDGAIRVWYPADDPTLHAFTLMQRSGVTFNGIKSLSLNALYQRAYQNVVDRVWVVSSRDKRWSQGVGGFPQIDVIPNGVDASYYRPDRSVTQPKTCIFWGRLDFLPNVHALNYFLDVIWPRARTVIPSASFIVCGAQPTPQLRKRLSTTEGVTFHENLADLRPQINKAEVSVFPMVSGAGVKNKVLEAAAMGKPILASPLCLGGLNCSIEPPFEFPQKPNEWVDALTQLWSCESTRNRAGSAARDWVMHQHSWNQSAQAVIDSLHNVARSSVQGQGLLPTQL